MRFLLAILLLLPGLAAADTSRVSVPISQTLLPNGDIRYAVPVRVGGSVTVPALLDTGSTGLHIFRAAVFNDSFTDTGFASLYEFGGGDKLTGTVGTGVVWVGPESTDEAVPFEIVTQAGCADFRPDCSASMVAAQDYGIGGDGISGQGFQAILGISLRVDGGASYTANPLVHMGAGKWIVELPEPGSSADGQLILNPDAADLQGFTMFSLNRLGAAGQGLDSGWDDALPGCLDDATNGQKICGPAILDTGSPGVVADVVGGGVAPLWGQDDRVTMSFTGAGGEVDLPFVADRNPGTGLLQEPAGPAGARLVDGFLPFFYYDVLYDAVDGEMGLRARGDAPTGVMTPAAGNDAVEVIQLNAPAPGAPKLPVVIGP
jgi:hypothetical protein